MKAGGFGLRRLGNLAEHLAGTGEIEAAIRDQILQRSQDMVRAVDIGVQRGELIIERIRNEALRGEMITFVRAHFVEHLIHTGETLE